MLPVARLLHLGVVRQSKRFSRELPVSSSMSRKRRRCLTQSKNSRVAAGYNRCFGSTQRSLIARFFPIECSSSWALWRPHRALEICLPGLDYYPRIRIIVHGPDLLLPGKAPSRTDNLKPPVLSALCYLLICVNQNRRSVLRSLLTLPKATLTSVVLILALCVESNAQRAYDVSLQAGVSD